VTCIQQLRTGKDDPSAPKTKEIKLPYYRCLSFDMWVAIFQYVFFKIIFNSPVELTKRLFGDPTLRSNIYNCYRL
jgi:hypothetical protein